MYLVLLPILRLLSIKFNGYEILEVEKVNNFLPDRPIPGKQDRVRGNKNIFTDGLIVSGTEEVI